MCIVCFAHDHGTLYHYVGSGSWLQPAKKPNENLKMKVIQVLIEVHRCTDSIRICVVRIS